MSTPNCKDWVNEKNRFGETYLKGVDDFIDFIKRNKKDEQLETFLCPCVKCKNRLRHKPNDIRNHLIRNGILKSYTRWFLHGDTSGQNLVEADTSAECQTTRLEELIGNLYDTHKDNYIDEAEISIAKCDISTDKYSEYKRLASEKLYPTCDGDDTTLSAIVELHNLKKQYGWSGNSVSALLLVLKRWLPQGNTLPLKYPHMKSILKDLGMKENFIHACVNDCILFYKQYEHLETCPKCGESRYAVKTKKGGRSYKEPLKVLRHFPLIPRLLRFFTIAWIAHEMTWHHRAASSWDVQRHPCDSAQWKIFKHKWPEFANEGRNVWLGVATDGFNPRGIQSSSYSCWPVIIVPYNLPPSLCLKREFQILSLLIPGPKAPGQDIDIYLEPLVDELQQLWHGVLAYDMHNKEHFTLKATLLWGIHDFPAYGNLSGCITHGYKACPICATDTDSIRLENGKKIVYTNYRRFLNMDHPFRKGGHLGLRSTDFSYPPVRVNGDNLLKQLALVHYIPGKKLKGKKRKNVQETDSCAESNSAVVSEPVGFYKRSIFFDLEYWSSHKLRHVIDVMHTGKNVAEHLISTILDDKHKSKDTINSRLDMQAMGIHSGQWLQTDEVSGKQIKPKASFLLDNQEKMHFCQILKDMKLHSSFSSNLSNIVTLKPPGLHSLKSHDYHVILCYLLPVLIQHAFLKHRDLRRAIQQLSLYFNLLCSKVIVRENIQRAKNMIAEALCVMEKHFPPSFFDISVHLTVHLADEALICGPTGPRWMYPFERQMKEFKDIPSNKRYIEGSIAESYVIAESVRYCMEHMPNPLEGNHKRTREAFLEEDGEFSDEGPLLDDKSITLEPVQFQQIRRWVIFRLNVDGLEDYYNAYQALINNGRGKAPQLSEVEMQTSFIAWLYEEMLSTEQTAANDPLWRLVQGPKHLVKTYKKYRANGFVFSPRYHDETVVTQDSGVCLKAWTTFRAKKGDKNLKESCTMWYGVIRQIIELDYTTFKEVVFYCDWVRVEDKTNGCKLCPNSNLVLVNLDKLKSSDNVYDEPAILASEASQVFYSKDIKNPIWWAVIHSPKRLTSHVDDIAVPSDFQSTLEDQPHLDSLLEQFKSK